MEPTAFLDALSRIGVDVPDALARFMGNRDLYLVLSLPPAQGVGSERHPAGPAQRTGGGFLCPCPRIEGNDRKPERPHPLPARPAIAYIHRNSDRICAVLLDICLGRRGAGFQVLQQLQAAEETSSLPVILITSDAGRSMCSTA